MLLFISFHDFYPQEMPVFLFLSNQTNLKNQYFSIVVFFKIMMKDLIIILGE